MVGRTSKENEEITLPDVKEPNNMRDIIEQCAICGFPLTAKYPDDYPDEYKFCCSCFKWARRLTGFGDHLVGDICVTNVVVRSAILQKLIDRITLVKGNKRLRKYGL